MVSTGGLAELRFFLDRGLGSRIVPEALRGAGWLVTTMDERYGPDESNRVSDERWIADAASLGEVLLCKDRAIASGPAEAQAVYMHDARVFVLANANLTGPVMGSVFLANQLRIVRMASRARGPYVVSVSHEGLRRIRLGYPPR